MSFIKMVMQKCLFERNEEEKFPHLGEDVKLNKIDEAKFKTYTDDFDGNESILFYGNE